MNAVVTHTSLPRGLRADLFPGLSGRYDLVGFDPRGTGQTEGAIDCRVNQETQGIYSQPFFTPLNVDPVALLAKAEAYVQRCLALNDRRLMRISRPRTWHATWRCFAGRSATRS